MKLTIKTNIFREMVSKAVKGASCNKLIPLTSMMEIVLENGVLTLHTTDMTNHLYIRQKNISGEDFSVTVQVEQFSKLVEKMTSENISLKLDNKALEVNGNGVYNIELPMDENGNPIKFPNPMAEVNEAEVDTTIKLSTIKNILFSVKPSIAVTMEVPCYMGYYVGDRVIGTDTYKIAGLNVKLFDNAKLINPEMMNLLDVMTAEEISVIAKNNVLVFITEDCIVYGFTMDGIEEFAVDAIESLIDTEFSCNCKIPKAEILRVLDRLSLFVGAYDNNGINLTFTEDGLQIRSKSSSGVENIGYIGEVDNVKPFNCSIDINMLTTQIKALSEDFVNIYFDPDIQSSIKIVEGELTQILALLED